ncbi:MAG: hypothetical protein AB1560_02680 [Pseudomonadota bacterium]
MIKEFERYHGVVFARILHSSKCMVSLQPYPTPGNSSYVVNGNIGIYIKYSGKRMSPWRFSFTREHQEEIKQMRDQLGKVFVVFVCGTDGVVSLSYNELKSVLDDTHGDVEWVSISRSARKMYLIKGSDGKLPFKAGKRDFPQSLFDEGSGAIKV